MFLQIIAIICRNVLILPIFAAQILWAIYFQDQAPVTWLEHSLVHADEVQFHDKWAREESSVSGLKTQKRGCDHPVQAFLKLRLEMHPEFI